MAFTIAIDFDGTIAKHYSHEPVPYAFYWMKRLKKAGATLVLWTMRHPMGSSIDSLPEAVKFCKQHGIVFDGLNRNPTWQGASPKARAQVYIDDLAYGCPLRKDKGKPNSRPYVNWQKVGPGVMRRMMEHNERYAFTPMTPATDRAINSDLLEVGSFYDRPSHPPRITSRREPYRGAWERQYERTVDDLFLTRRDEKDEDWDD